MKIINKNAMLYTLDDKIIGRGYIRNKNTFEVFDNDILVYKFTQFNHDSYNVFNKVNDFIGIIRKSNDYKFNLIINNEVTGYLLIQ